MIMLRLARSLKLKGHLYEMSRLASSWTGTGTINTKAYPIDQPDSDAFAELVRGAQSALKSTGCASFPGFWKPQAVSQAVASALESVDDAFETDSTHNAYQIPGADSSFSDTHPRNVFMRTRVASTAYDELPKDGPLHQLYNSEEFTSFVAAVVGKNENEFFRLADPLGACSINIFRPGWHHAWHFDESEFTTTLCLQQSEEGGEFEFTPALRHSTDDLAAAQVAEILNHNSPYKVDEEVDNAYSPTTSIPITKASFEPGTLQIFAGRYSLHHVKRIPEYCKKDRLVAVLCFAETAGYTNSKDVQEMFWGRSA